MDYSGCGKWDVVFDDTRRSIKRAVVPFGGRAGVVVSFFLVVLFFT